MRKRIPLLIVSLIVLAMALFFANIFVTYAQPMRSDSIDLPLVARLDEVTNQDRSTELGWTVYTQEGDAGTPLAYDGFACYDGLQYLGQTFYYSRVMTEELDAATLSLTSANRNFSVFLDGVLIYTDCPEQDNRIGYLTLSTREWERTESINISLPEGYVGKTLTIAQSTPLYAETPSMLTRVVPATVTLYCSYAYESALIAESFQTAYLSAITYVVDVLVLFFFLRRTAQGNLDVSLLLLALAFFLTMTSRMYDTTYHFRYFGLSGILDVPLLCRRLAQVTLLFILASRARRIRVVAWSVSIVYAVCVALRIDLLVFNNTSLSSLQSAFFTVVDSAGFILPFIMLLLFWLERKQEGFFRRWFAPTGCLSVVFCVLWQLTSGKRDAFLASVSEAVTNLCASAFAWPLTTLLLASCLILMVIDVIREEINAHTEKRLTREMAHMYQQRYENLHRHNEEVMMLRHDMQRHYRLLRQTTTAAKPAITLDLRPQQKRPYRSTVWDSKLSAKSRNGTVIC